MGGLLYFLAVLFLVFWVVGFVFAHVAAPIIHLLLVAAVILFIVQLATGRQRTV